MVDVFPRLRGCDKGCVRGNWDSRALWTILLGSSLRSYRACIFPLLVWGSNFCPRVPWPACSWRPHPTPSDVPRSLNYLGEIHLFLTAFRMKTNLVPLYAVETHFSVRLALASLTNNPMMDFSELLKHEKCVSIRRARVSSSDPKYFRKTACPI